MIRRAVTQGLSAGAKTAFHFLRSIVTLDVFNVYIGQPRAREMRVDVIVLADESGPLLTEEDTGRWARLHEAIDEARRIFTEQVNVVIKPETNSEMIKSMTAPAPSFALNVGCNRRAYREGLSEAGEYFESHSGRGQRGGFLRRGVPITVFVVRSIEGKSGCSLGPLADYVTVDIDVFDDRRGARGEPLWTVAHELGHACNLWHHGDTLMRPGPGGRKDFLKKWQRVLFRASSHITNPRQVP